MTAQKLHAILLFLDALDKKLSLQKSIEAVATDLVNLANSPADPTHQTALASHLSAFVAATDKLGAEIAPSDAAEIKDMGGKNYFDQSIGESVRNAIQTNAMTPSVARDFVQQLAKGRAEFLSIVRSTTDGLGRLGIKGTAPTPGTADMAFLIPRELFDNQLLPFSKELRFIALYLENLGEALTGEVRPVQVEQLSSSLPTISLAACIAVISTVALAVNKFLDAWERIERIRKVREELSGLGMAKGANAKELDDEITTTVENVVEETTTTVLLSYKGSTGRKHELENGVRNGTRRLFGQIERGLKIDFRANSENASDEEAKKSLAEISQLSKVIKFPEIAQEPLLLQEGELLEGDIEIKRIAKTATKKTTATTKKSPDATPV